MIEQIEKRASLMGIGLLWAHASLAARPAFAAVGFTVRKREEVELGESGWNASKWKRHFWLRESPK